MAYVSGDQIVFLLVSLILASCFINTVEVLRRERWVTGEIFWLYGLFSLSTSYLAYGVSPWVGRPGLIVANIAFLISYISLALQLRFWLTKKSNIPVWLTGSSVIYVIAFEWSRDYLPYIARASFGQIVILMLAVYLIVTSQRLYSQKRSRQIMLLSLTFVVESACAMVRLVMLWVEPASTVNTSSILNEPFYMVVVRWVWVVANAMSYLTIMTYVLEKTLDRNDELSMLLKEKQLLINAMSKISRNQQAGGMASAMVHELSQPLSTLLLMSKRLKDQVKQHDFGTLDTQVEVLFAETDKSAKTLLQLEKLLRIKNSPKQSVLLSEVIDGALLVLSPRLTANGILLVKSGRFDVMLRVEPTQIELVFINLISNAIAVLSSQAGKRVIQLKCATHQNQCTVEVIDNGPGIRPEVLSGLGQIYVSDKESGSGVGLWLSKLIIDHHNGQFEAGNHPSGGATFRVTLPVDLAAGTVTELKNG